MTTALTTTRTAATTKRQRLLLAGLALSLLASLWAMQSPADDAVVPAVAASRRPAPAARPPAALALSWPAPPAARSAWPPGRPSAAWGQAPQRQRMAEPPPSRDEPPVEAGPPPAPRFPYQLIGRIDDGALAQALLTSDRRTLGVKAQDVIDGQWRVDAVDARGLTVTWLPGGQTLTLALRPA